MGREMVDEERERERERDKGYGIRESGKRQEGRGKHRHRHQDISSKWRLSGAVCPGGSLWFPLPCLNPFPLPLSFSPCCWCSWWRWRLHYLSQTKATEVTATPFDKRLWGHALKVDSESESELELQVALRVRDRCGKLQGVRTLDIATAWDNASVCLEFIRILMWD